MFRHLAGLLTGIIFVLISMEVAVLAVDYSSLVEPLDYYDHRQNELEQKLAAAPENIVVTLELVEIYRDLGEWKAGLALIEPLMAQDPGNETYLALQTDLYLLKVNDVGIFGKMGAGKAMRKGCQRSLDANPDNVYARHCLARFYFFAPGLFGGDKEQGRAFAEQLKPLNLAIFYQARAEQLGKGEDWDAAASAYASAVAAGPDTTVMTAAGMYHMSRKDWDKACSYLRQAIVTDPENRLARYQLGHLSVLSMTNLEEGATSLMSFLAGPTRFQGQDIRASAHWRLGQIFEHQEKPGLAIKAFERALELDPRHKDAKKSLKALKKRGYAMLKK